MSDCIFCKIVAGTIPSTRVFEDDRCVAFRDLNPAAPTHVLVVPRKHLASLNDLSSDDAPLAGHLLQACARVAKELGHAEDGYRVAVNTNGDAGQTVFHLHLHVLAGRQFVWPPG